MAEETRRERDERLKNSGTVTRPTTSNTATRPSTSNTVTRPTNSNTVTRPTTSNTVTRPSTSNTVTRPSTSSDKPVFEDKSLVTVNYSVWVSIAGDNSTQVADVVLGDGWRERAINPKGSFGTEFGTEKIEKLQQIVASLKELGAIFEVKKIINIKNEYDLLTEVGEQTCKSNESYVITSWGNNKEEVLDILYGKERNHNLSYSLPVTLTYNGDEPVSEKEFMLLQLRTAGARVEIKKNTILEIKLL